MHERIASGHRGDDVTQQALCGRVASTRHELAGSLRAENELCHAARLSSRRCDVRWSRLSNEVSGRLIHWPTECQQKMRTRRPGGRVKQYRMRAERLSHRVEQQQCPFVELAVTENQFAHVCIDPEWNESSIGSRCTNPFRLVRNVPRVDAVDDDPTRISVASVVQRFDQRSEIRIGVKSHHAASNCKRRRATDAPEYGPSSPGVCNFFVYNAFRMLRFLSAGESHGQALVITLDGMPAGLDVDIDALNAQLRRRQGGYGRGRRMAIESDRAEILAGVRRGKTTGAPIAMLIRNRDWVNWQQTMHVEHDMPEGASGTKRPEVTRPRPGHADLAGAVKYGHEDIRDVLERASARETASRVAAGSLARQLLAHFGIRIASHVSSIGDVALPEDRVVSFDEARAIDDEAPLRCADSQLQQKMIAFIDAAKDAGDTVGGSFEVIATGVPPGLGSYVQWDRKLDGRLAQVVMCIHAIKAVGIGIGPDASFRPGSRVHDEILPPRPEAVPPVRPTNRAGGLEGGVTNGQDVRVTGFMKPIATLMKPLRSVDLNTLTDAPAAIERSDVCAVPAAAVVGEAMVALVLADAFLEKFGGDSIEEIARHYEATAEQVRRRFTSRTTA